MFKLNENSSVSAAEAIGIRTAVTGRQLSQKVVIMSDLVINSDGKDSHISSDDSINDADYAPLNSSLSKDSEILHTENCSTNMPSTSNAEVPPEGLVDERNYRPKKEYVPNENTLGEEVEWSTIMILHFEKAYPNIIQFKMFYRSKEYTSIKATATMAGRKVIANLYPIAAYNKPPKISTKKKEGLLYLCDNNYIPIQHHHFYKELRTTAEDNYFNKNYKNFTVDTLGEEVEWSTIMILHFEKAYPNIIQFKMFYRSKEYTSIKATATMAGRKVIANLYPIAAYNKPPKISTKKKEGLLYLCDNNYIPIQHHHFYKELRTTAEDVADPE
ncbi:hypothetical protein QE152_g15627 [Popillia japonica]|uniref:Uncharacterized protein n=1 Tax=Popillia japonica TaxID=7064 RepID=A0AAW1L569_POPJA